jgi:hypothetical protein
MQSMYGISALDVLERAEAVATELGRDVDAAGFLFSRWTALGQGIQLDRSGPLARLLLERGRGSSNVNLRAYGLSAWGIHQWSTGNVGEAFRYLRQASRLTVNEFAPREGDPVLHDLQLLMTGLYAETTALHGEVEAALALLDVLRDAGDDPYTDTVWATIASRLAALVGDTDLALEASEIGLAVDPGFSFVFLGTYQRLAHCWARALTGAEPEGAIAEAQQLVASNLMNPPRSCVATWYGLIGEMLLATGALDEATASLDRADACLDAYGQRYPEGLLLLLRARVLHARGEPPTVVRAAIDRSRAVSTSMGAHLFVSRANRFESELDIA